MKAYTRLISSILLVSLLVGLTTPTRNAHAQSDTAPERLIYGDTITRDFTPEIGAFVFSFNAQKGDVITITMVAETDGAIDPALVLLGPNAKLTAQNDDSLDEKFGLTNARLVNYPILVAGGYLIKATRDSQATPSGSFTLALKGKRSGQAGSAISFGQAAQGTISSSAGQVSYEFRAARGDVLSAEVRSASKSSLTPYIALLDPTNVTLIAVTANAKDLTVATLTRALIPDDGIYTLVVSRAGLDKGTTNGDFRLTLTRDAQAVLLNYGDSNDAELSTSTPEIRYIFQGKANDVVTVSMIRKSGTLDPYLTLLILGGGALTANDSGLGKDLKKGDARITKYKLPGNGLYVIVAGRAGGANATTQGKFTLSLDATVPKVTP